MDFHRQTVFQIRSEIEADYISRIYSNLANRIERSVMYLQVSLSLFTI